MPAVSTGSSVRAGAAGSGASARGGVRVPEVAPADIELTRFVRPGDAVLIPQGAGEPLALTAALVEQSPRLGGITAFLGMCYNPRLGHGTGMALRSYGALGAAAAMTVDVLGVHMSAIPELVRSGRIGADVLLCQVSPADAQGYHHLGLSVDYVMAALDVARVVIAEVNPAVPATPGPGRVHRSRFTATIESDHGLIQVSDPAQSEVESAIGARVAALFPPQATLQLGVGALAAAVARAVRGHRGLRVHSGMLGDWLVDLAEAGALAEPHDGPTVVSGSAMGTDRLYRYLDGNPAVELRPVERVHDGQVLAAIPRLVAVNSALQVDLSGQVNAEGIGSRPMGAIGGQVDFLRGAMASPGGVGVIALPATASRGSTSRVVRTLDGPVTTGRADVQWVVTEYGAADLRGSAPAERARALIEIAAPQFRAELAGG